MIAFEGSELLAASSADATLIEVTDGHRLKAAESKHAYLAAIAESLTV